MKTLIVSILSNKQINPNLANIISAANQLDAPIDLLLIGEISTTVMDSYSNLVKVMQVKCVDELLIASNIAPVVVKYSKGYTHVLMAADSVGKDILPRVAGVLGAAQISEVTKICSPNIFKRPIYAGNIVAQVESFEEIKLLTIRPTSFEPTRVIDKQAIDITILNDAVVSDNRVVKLSISSAPSEGGMMPATGLAMAKKIVSGGKSLGSKEEYDRLIRGLAKKIDAAVGASRDAVEAGLVTNDCQVGQTGKIVAPDLYLAVGISGAVQHIAGMKDSKTVLAINIDPTAQIFEYSDYGFEGDLFDVIPQLIEKL